MHTLIEQQTTMTLLRGSRLGPYLIRRLLQQGGMSSVYLAYDEETYTTVALKVLTLQNNPTGDEQVEQFRRERHIMRSLRHDHILPLLGAGRQGAFAYLVMPYMAGGSLKDRMEQGSLSQAEARVIFEQLADALHSMHSFGILHRDIKPANILFDENGSAYLADFGIASYVGESAIERNGQVMGTPLYMSPELCYGEASVSSDIYALGTLLYQMLTGLAPFESTNAQYVCVRQIEEIPVHPSHLNAAISPAIEQVMLCALEKEITLRFTSIASFVEAYQTACTPVSIFGKAHAFMGAFVSSLETRFQSSDSVYKVVSDARYNTEAVFTW